MTGAAITANLMRNNSFRVDSVQKLLGPHKFSKCLERERDKHSKRDRLEEEERERGEKGGRPLSPAAVASFFIVADNE